MSTGLPIDRILYSKFIPYKSLSALTLKEFDGSNATYITIYLDLSDFLFQVPRNSYDIEPRLLVSIVLNYCAHLREFYKRIGVYTRIILVYTENYGNSSAEYIPEFNEVFRKRQDIAKQNLPQDASNSLSMCLLMLKTLIKYIRDIYFVDVSFNTSVVIKDLIENVFPGTPNIVISESQFCFQLPCYSDCVVFHKKRRKGDIGFEDISYSYNIDTAIEEYIYELRKLYLVYRIHPCFISILMSMIGVPKFSIKNIFSIHRAIEILKNMNPNSYGDEFVMYNTIDTYLTNKEAKAYPFSVFSNRYRGIDLNYQQIAYMTYPESRDRRFMIKLNDPDKVKAINNNYFINYPIDLQRL